MPDQSGGNVSCQSPGTKIKHCEPNLPPFEDAVSENALIREFLGNGLFIFLQTFVCTLFERALTPLDGVGTGGEPLTRNKKFQNMVAQWKQDTHR